MQCALPYLAPAARPLSRGSSSLSPCAPLSASRSSRLDKEQNGARDEDDEGKGETLGAIDSPLEPRSRPSVRGGAPRCVWARLVSCRRPLVAGRGQEGEGEAAEDGLVSEQAGLVVEGARASPSEPSPRRARPRCHRQVGSLLLPSPSLPLLLPTPSSHSNHVRLLSLLARVALAPPRLAPPACRGPRPLPRPTSRTFADPTRLASLRTLPARRSAGTGSVNVGIKCVSLPLPSLERTSEPRLTPSSRHPFPSGFGAITASPRLFQRSRPLVLTRRHACSPDLQAASVASSSATRELLSPILVSSSSPASSHRSRPPH